MITHTKGAIAVQDLVLLVDEVDMVSPAKEYSWNGAEHFLQARCFYGCTASPLTTDEWAKLRFPPDTTIRHIAQPPSAVVVRSLSLIEETDITKAITKLIIRLK